MPSSACSSPSRISPLSLHDALPILMNPFSRIVLCGLIAEYSAKEPYAHTALRAVLVNRIRMQGMIVFDWKARYGEAIDALRRHLEADRKSTRLNSSHVSISYAVFCLLLPVPDLPSFPTRRSSDLDESVFAHRALRAYRRIQREGAVRAHGASCGAREPHPHAGHDRVRLEGPLRRSDRRIAPASGSRSEEHTSELQSRFDLVCRLLLAPPRPGSPLFPYTTLFRS